MDASKYYEENIIPLLPFLVVVEDSFIHTILPDVTVTQQQDLALARSCFFTQTKKREK